MHGQQNIKKYMCVFSKMSKPAQMLTYPSTHWVLTVKELEHEADC